MRLVIDARMFYASGIGTYLRNLLPALINICPDIEYILLGDNNKLATFDWPANRNIKVIDCNFPIYSIREQMKLPGIIPPCDLFFSPHYNVPIFYSGNMITTIHDVFHLSRENKQRTIPRYLYARLMFSWALRKSKIVMTDSEYTLSEMRKYKLPCLEKVKVVYLGFGIKEKEISVKENNSEKYLLYVGNVKPHKNLKRLIEAYKLLHKQNRINLSLKIVGEAEKFITGMPELKKDISESSWSQWIKFTGWVDDNKLRLLYKNAAALVLPSLYEGFGLPPLEAMVYGCPCVVSDAASLPEICGDAVLYCNPYDVDDIAEKIVTILENKQLRIELVSKGFEQIKLYKWEKTARTFLSLAEEIVDQ